MAVVGKKLSDTLRLGSDVVNEQPCSPCAKGNRNVEAIKYCVDCDENICGKCESDHKRFAGMRDHQIEDKPRKQAGQIRLDLPTTICDKHGGKFVDVYCPSHDIVACSTCVAVDHSTCQGIQYIPNIAKGIGTSEKLNDLQVKLADLQKQIASLKLRKQGHIKQLQQDKEKILKDVTALRKKITDHLDEMQKRLLEEVDVLFDLRLKDIVTSIKKVENIESKAEKLNKTLQGARNISDAELFVQFIDGSAYVKKNAEFLKDLGISVDERAMVFNTSKKMEWFMSEKASFGDISCCTRRRVSLLSDKTRCEITDACLLDNDKIVIVDYANKRLKILDNSYTVTEHFDMADNPFGVCEIDIQQFAVTLINHKKVQFVSQKGLMFDGASFSVGDRCRGIACHNCFLYVCCGGSKKYVEGPGHIEVYSLAGELIQSLTDGLNYPVFLHHLDARNELIISDYVSVSPYKSRLVAIDLYGHSLSVIKTDKLKCPLGFCMVDNDQLFILGNNSNNLVLVSKDGQVQKELLTQKSGLVQPYAVCFGKKQKRIIITSQKSNTIKLFRLEM